LTVLILWCIVSETMSAYIPEGPGGDTSLLTMRVLLEMRAAAESVAMDVYNMADGLPGWQQMAHFARYNGDAPVYSHQSERVGPYEVTTDPDGRAGNWGVELVRSTVRYRREQFAGQIGMRKVLLPPLTSVDLRVNVHDNDFEDPLEILQPRAPRSAKVHQAVVLQPRGFDVTIPVATPYGKLLAMERDHKFAQSWLGMV